MVKLAEIKLGDEFSFEPNGTVFVVSGFTKRKPLKVKVPLPGEWKYEPHTMVYTQNSNFGDIL